MLRVSINTSIYRREENGVSRRTCRTQSRAVFDLAAARPFAIRSVYSVIKQPGPATGAVTRKRNHTTVTVKLICFTILFPTFTFNCEIVISSVPKRAGSQTVLGNSTVQVQRLCFNFTVELDRSTFRLCLLHPYTCRVGLRYIITS